MNKTETIIIRVTPEQKNAIKKVADHHHRGNMSAMILYAYDYWQTWSLFRKK